MKNLIAVVLALLIGVACRWFEIPVPAPPRLSGALLILAVTLGYVLTDTWISRRTSGDSGNYSPQSARSTQRGRREKF